MTLRLEYLPFDADSLRAVFARFDYAYIRFYLAEKFLFGNHVLFAAFKLSLPKLSVNSYLLIRTVLNKQR